jgi:WD40 repeat protein/tRNA A-37 threonylcarbamoyl transferase component Bud32
VIGSEPGRGRSSPRAGNEWPRIRGYEILSVIGSGGMGIVYKARHRDLNRTVALKMLRGAALDDPEFRERLQAEAEAVARTQHPNIIQVFEVGTAECAASGEQYVPFIALEFVDGGNLCRLAERPQSSQVAAQIVEKLARATSAAHRLGVVHRDLKPANVLLTADGEPKIADFGLAKQLTNSKDSTGRFVTQAGTIVGTPEYMAPEQAAGEAPSPAVDIYALGVILYELLTGRVPFQGATPIETMTLVRGQEPVSPRRLQPGVPRDLDTICTKCLEKDAGRRYASSHALAEDLKLFLDGKPIQARRITDSERVARWCKRNPLVASSLMGVVATFLLAFALVSRSYWRAEGDRREAIAQRDKAEEREKAERWEHYQASILAAASALQVNNVAGARRELEAAPEEHRAWEWDHFHSRLDAATYVLGGLDGPLWTTEVLMDGRRVLLSGPTGGSEIWDPINRRRLARFASLPQENDFARSRDGKLFAIILSDNTVEVYNAEAGQVVAELRGHRGNINSIKMTADGSRVMTKSADKTIRVWDAATGAELRCFEGPINTFPVSSWSPDGRFLALAENEDEDRSREVELWDMNTATRVARMRCHGKHRYGSRFSLDGRYLVTIGDLPDYVVEIWDGTTGAAVAKLVGHTNRVDAIEFSPDGTRIATGAMDQTVRLWDVKTGKPIETMKGHRGWIYKLAFSPDGRRLASASQDHTLRVWDAVTGEPVEVLHGHTNEVVGVAYTADGKNLISTANDGTIRVWDARLIEANGVLKGHQSYVYSVAVHPDGERVASASWDGTVRIWEATSGRVLATLDHGIGKDIVVTSVAFHPDGKLLASRTRDTIRKGRDTIYLWDVEAGKEVRRWHAESDHWRDTRLAFSHDGKMLASGLGGDRVGIWDVATNELAVQLGPIGDSVRDVAFSKDGRWLAAASEDKLVWIWDMASKSVVAKLAGHTNATYAVAFSPDGGSLVSGSIDGTARVWNTSNWSEAAVLRHPGKVYGLAFTTDGTRLACGCLDNSVRLWDTASFREVAELRGHDGYVHSVAFTPDGTRLISGSGDHTVRVWDTLAPQVRAGRWP